MGARAILLVWDVQIARLIQAKNALRIGLSLRDTADFPMKRTWLQHRSKRLSIMRLQEVKKLPRKIFDSPQKGSLFAICGIIILPVSDGHPPSTRFNRWIGERSKTRLPLLRIPWYWDLNPQTSRSSDNGENDFVSPQKGSFFRIRMCILHLSATNLAELFDKRIKDF